jgi:hypothetical protein
LGVKPIRIVDASASLSSIVKMFIVYILHYRIPVSTNVTSYAFKISAGRHWQSHLQRFPELGRHTIGRKEQYNKWLIKIQLVSRGPRLRRQ